MDIIQTTSELKSRIKEHNNNNHGLIGFIPTMGALHKGHSSLIEKSSKECALVIVSILVNPTQFNDSTDFNKYPKSMDDDEIIVEKSGGHVIFAPTAEELYEGEPIAAEINWGDLTNKFEGASRPGHFDGVVAVVDRLFDVVKPDRAYFGAKDLQQVAVVSRLASERHPEVEVVSCDLVRDPKGLALSSRNERLTERGKADAVVIFRALNGAVAKMREGVVSRSEAVIEAQTEISGLAGVDLEYLGGVDFNRFSEESLEKSWTHIVVAAWVEGVRLIDNIEL